MTYRTNLATTRCPVRQASTGARAARSAEPAVIAVALPLLRIVTLSLSIVRSRRSNHRFVIVPCILRKLSRVVVRRVVLGLIRRRGDRTDGARSGMR